MRVKEEDHEGMDGPAAMRPRRERNARVTWLGPLIQFVPQSSPKSQRPTSTAARLAKLGSD